MAGMVELGVKAGLIELAGSWYSYNGQSIGQGADKATDAIKNFPELLDGINTWLKTTGYSTINENVRAAEELNNQVSGEVDETQTEVETTGKTKRLKKK